MMAGEKIRIIIVDDHPVISHGLKNIFYKNSGMDVVGEAGDAGGAVKLAASERPDVVVLDISLAGGDGVSLIGRLLEASSSSKIVMYTMHDGVAYIRRSLQTGALGYVLKSDSMKELVEAVIQASRGRLYLSSSIPQTVLQEMITGKSSCDSPLSFLTSREFEVAALIAKGLRPEEIGGKLHISPKTVRVHRTNIMHKFACKGVHDLLLQLRQHFPQ